MKTNLIHKEEVTLDAGDQKVIGDLAIPENARSIVVFCHGINSSRHSPRNVPVADLLNRNGIATLLVSIEKIDEDLFLKGSNLELLTKRFVHLTKYIMEDKRTASLSIGYFGSGTGAAVALAASTKLPGVVKAVVCRNGRPEAATDLFKSVKSPVLLLCAEKDKEGIALNEMALEHLTSPCEMRVIRNASQLFEEHGKIGEVANLATDWYRKFLNPVGNRLTAGVNG